MIIGLIEYKTINYCYTYIQFSISLFQITFPQAPGNVSLNGCKKLIKLTENLRYYSVRGKIYDFAKQMDNPAFTWKSTLSSCSSECRRKNYDHWGLCSRCCIEILIIFDIFFQLAYLRDKQYLISLK